MPTLKELNAKVRDRFKRDGVKEFFVRRIDANKAHGRNHWKDGSKSSTWWGVTDPDDWERIEGNPEAVTEPPQHVYAYLAAQYGIVIIADSVTYDGTKAHLGGEND